MTPYSDSQVILNTFKKLQADHKEAEARIKTKEDLSAIQAEKELVQKASAYNSESIFQALAKLQTTFGQSVEELTKEMDTEAEKLISIREAIRTENQHLKTLQDIRVAAEALNILQQEHQHAVDTVEKEYQQRFDDLETEAARQRDAWDKSKQDYESSQAKQQAALERERQSEEEDYTYGLDRQQTENSDDYEKRKRVLEYELEEETRTREKDWAEREKYLEEHQKEFDENKVQVEAMPDKIDEAVKKAREEGIRETAKDEEHKAQLQDKEAEASKKTLELKIESLNKTVELQAVQVAALTEKLQAALDQVQELAMTAVTSAGKSITEN